MVSRVFEFFEVLAEELCDDPDIVYTNRDLEGREPSDSSFLPELVKECRVAAASEAIPAAVEIIDKHFVSKNLVLPFAFDRATSRFQLKERSVVEFIRKCSHTRSLKAKSREFEEIVLNRLKDLLPGRIHRVGAPRKKGTKISTVNSHLKKYFGFMDDVLTGPDKDGGFDILWAVPIGTDPFHPLFSIQCKNGKFRDKEASASIAQSDRSFAKHRRLLREAHVNCVVFNDYFDTASVFRRGVQYVPIGLSDLVAGSAVADVQTLW